MIATIHPPIEPIAVPTARPASPITAEGALTLQVNGSLKVTAHRAELQSFDALLRGIALSDSPVLIERGRPEDRIAVAARLHALGRRAPLPIHECRNSDEAAALLRAIVGDPSTDAALGSWALHEVGAWDEATQHALEHMLARFDEGRLSGCVGHEHIPRVMVLASEASKTGLVPKLLRRLSFFRIALIAPGAKEKVQ